MPDFSRIISMAYVRILERPPDPGGLENYNRLMNEGLSEAMMREALLRSAEYAQKNPGPTAAATSARASATRTQPRPGGRQRTTSRSRRKRA
jgi:hypothetical protein